MNRSAEDPDVEHALAVLDGSCHGDKKAARLVVASVEVGARPTARRPVQAGHERIHAVVDPRRLGLA